METKLTPRQLDFYSTMLWQWSVSFLPELLTAIAILIGGFILAGWAARTFRAVLARTSRADETLQPVLASAVRYGILALVMVAALAQLGIQTASLLALLGAAGLAIGLALQGTLTNIAAGIMLLWLRPFRIGDFIEVPANNVIGTVREIGLFVTQLENFDGIVVYAPNSSIWNSALRNHTRNPARLLSFGITLPGEAEPERAREILTKMLREDSRVLRSPEPLIFVDSYYGTNGILLNCCFHAQRQNVGEIQRTIIVEAKRRLESSGAEALAPRQIVRSLPVDADPSRLTAGKGI